MKVDKLQPAAEHRAPFTWSHHVTVPGQPGCYALVSVSGDVLYVGLASASVRDRMGAHLDTPDKRKACPLGSPYWIYYTLQEAQAVNAIERGWMNQAILEDGDIPPLNRMYSPL